METGVAQNREGEERAENRRPHAFGQIPQDDQQRETVPRRCEQDSATSVAARPAKQIPPQIQKDGQSQLPGLR